MMYIFLAYILVTTHLSDTLTPGGGGGVMNVLPGVWFGVAAKVHAGWQLVAPGPH